MALWLRSTRRRPGAALGLFLIVVVASAASVTGPALVRAAEQSGLRSALAAARPGQYDIDLDAPTDQSPPSTVTAATSAAASAADPHLFLPPLVFTRSQRSHQWRAGRTTYSAPAASPLAGCAQADLASGACPVLQGEALAPSAARFRTGERVAITGRTGSFTVVGLYRAAAVPAWVTGLGRGPVLTMDRRCRRSTRRRQSPCECTCAHPR